MPVRVLEALLFRPYLCLELTFYVCPNLLQRGAQAILEFSIFGLVAIVGDVFWGVMGDRIGWRNTLQWAATPITAASLLYIYLIPIVTGPNFLLITLGTAGIGKIGRAHV